MAEYGNHLIRKIVISTGVVTTVAGTGSTGSANGTTGTSASFNYPVRDYYSWNKLICGRVMNNHLIRKIVL